MASGGGKAKAPPNGDVRTHDGNGILSCFCCGSTTSSKQWSLYAGRVVGCHAKEGQEHTWEASVRNPKSGTSLAQLTAGRAASEDTAVVCYRCSQQIAIPAGGTAMDGLMAQRRKFSSLRRLRSSPSKLAPAQARR